jgi:hypothetical protein
VTGNASPIWVRTVSIIHLGAHRLDIEIVDNQIDRQPRGRRPLRMPV